MKRVRSLLFPLLAVGLVISSSTLAFDDTGHQVVAAIAWEKLDPAVQQKVDLLFPPDPKSKGHFVFTYSSKPSTPDNPFPKTVYNHVTIANWMDDLRDNSYDKPLAPWHYINRPFFDGIEPKLVYPETPNVREKIIEMIGVLRKLRAFDKFKDSTAAVDKERYADEAPKAAYAMAALFHLVGDVHQPLHCVTRYTKFRKYGDTGGNLFKIVGPKGQDNLHSYWDASGGLFDFKKLGREFDDDHQVRLKDFVGRVQSRWVEADHPGWKNFSPEEWVEDSHTVGKTEAYQGIKENEAPSDDYKAKVQAIAATRLMLAGLRLAAVLNAIYSEE